MRRFSPASGRTRTSSRRTSRFSSANCAARWATMRAIRSSFAANRVAATLSLRRSLTRRCPRAAVTGSRSRRSSSIITPILRVSRDPRGRQDVRMPARAGRRRARHGQDRALRRVPATGGRLPSVRICYGQCLEHAGPSEPYFPVLDALHHLARRSPSTIPKLLASVAPAWLSQLPPWVADAASPPGRATPDSSRLIRELSALFETLATDTTTVIVLEDLHWGDLATIELLRGLARRHARCARSSSRPTRATRRR